MVAMESEMVLRAKEWPPTSEAMDSGKGLDRCATQDTRVQVRRRKGRSKKKNWFRMALKKTTSRRSGQRRDVPERKSSNVVTLRPTSRRSRGCAKSTSRRWIPTSRRSRGG